MDQQPLEKVKGVADIVFLIDISGSMQTCIDALKTNIGTFVNSLATPDANGGSPVKDWRIKIAGYRDATCDGSKWWVEQPFVTDVNQVTANLAALEAKGGGDEPESLLDAIYKIAKMSATEKDAQPDPTMWRHRHKAARVVIFFTDATYRPTISIPEATGANVNDVIREIQASRIILNGFCPEHDCYLTLGEVDKSNFEFVGSLTEVQDEAQEAMKSFTANPDNFRKTLEALAKTVSVSSETLPL
jgi:hypothetical protein